MKQIFLSLLFLGLSSYAYCQGQFKIRNDNFIQIGYLGYKVLTFGQSTSTPNNGSFAIENYNNGLNIWKPWPTFNAGNYFLFIKDNGNIGMGNTGNTTEKLWISGNLRVNSMVYSSDVRFKQNMTPIKSVLGDLLLLQPYQYRFDSTFNAKYDHDSLSINVNKESKINYNFDDKLHFGFSAQELEKLYPNLVTKDDNGYLGVNYVELIPLLIKALQEQNEKITLLEEKLNSLSEKK
jgi:hypothetical protein